MGMGDLRAAERSSSSSRNYSSGRSNSISKSNKTSSGGMGNLRASERSTSSSKPQIPRSIGSNVTTGPSGMGGLRASERSTNSSKPSVGMGDLRTSERSSSRPSSGNSSHSSPNTGMGSVRKSESSSTPVNSNRSSGNFLSSAWGDFKKGVSQVFNGDSWKKSYDVAKENLPKGAKTVAVEGFLGVDQSTFSRYNSGQMSKEEKIKTTGVMLVNVLTHRSGGKSKVGAAASKVDSVTVKEAVRANSATVKGTGNSQIKQNKANGEVYEKKVMANMSKTHSDVTQQITVKTQSGAKTRLDIVGTNKKTGKTEIVEVKASQTAPLTKNQKKAFPEIEQSGAKVVGKGKKPFTGGTHIPPTQVQINRKKK